MATIQLRRDSAADWTSNDPTLAHGEWGYETDTAKLKIGDGVTAWTSLDYFNSRGNDVNWKSTVYKAADESVTSNTTLQDDNDFASFAVEANKNYSFEFYIYYLHSSTPDIKFDFDGPASPVAINIMTRNLGLTFYGASIVSQAYNEVESMLVNANEVRFLRISVYLENGANAGTLKFRWAQNSSSVTTVTLYKDSYCEWGEN